MGMGVVPMKILSPLKSEKALRGDSGVALAVALLALTIIITIGFALGTIGTRNLTTISHERLNLSAFYAAEMGVARAMYSLAQNPNPPTPNFTGTGNATNVSFVVQVTNNLTGATPVPGRAVPTVPAGYAELVSTGRSGSTTQRVVVLATRNVFNPFNWAAFGDSGVTLDSGSSSDSYDSARGGYGFAGNKGTDGDVGSNGNISLDTGAKIEGDASAGGTVTPYPPRPPTVITGTVTQGAPPVPLPPIDTSYQAPNDNSLITGTGWSWVPPGSRNLHVTNSGNVIFPAGKYYLDSIDIDSGGQLTVPSTLGATEKVTINLTGEFHADSGSRVNNATQIPGKLMIVTSATDAGARFSRYAVYLDSGSGFYGAIYAYNGTIRQDAGARVYGSTVAKTLSWDSGARFHYDVQLRNANLGSGGQGMLKKAWFQN